MAAGFSLGVKPSPSTAEQLGVPNYLDSFTKGVEQGYKPAQLSASLLSQHLKNALDQIKEKYAPQQAEATLKHLGAQTQGLSDEHGMVDLKRKLLESKIANAINPMQKAMLTAQATQNVKNIASGEQSIPQAEAMLKEIDQALEVIPRHKEWFGPGTLGFDWAGGPGARKRSITSEEYGPLEALFGRLVGPQAQELSHGNKVLATALNLAQGIKPGFNENSPIAYGKLNKIREQLANSIAQQKEVYHSSGGMKDLGNYQGFEPRTSFKNESDFDDYMKSLSPHQRNIVKKKIHGEK